MQNFVFIGLLGLYFFILKINESLNSAANVVNLETNEQ